MKAHTQKRLRNLHNWLGVFFAPGIVFFALSGVLQTIGLHESGPGRAPAAAWIGLLANVHKEGEAELPRRRPPPPAAPGKPSGLPREHEVKHESAGLPLFKAYVLLLSLALIGSTVMGIVIAFTNRLARRRTSVLLVAGCVVPLLLLAI